MLKPEKALTNVLPILIVGLLTCLSTSCLASDVPDVGPERCVANCGESGGGGPSPAPSWAPSGPSPQQLKQQREEKDLGEAAQDADDRGLEAYENGDYSSAVKYFSEALDYAPDDPDIQHRLERAREALRQAEAGRELKSVWAHSQAAAVGLGDQASSMEARRGFDTAGQSAGFLDTLAVNVSNWIHQDPIVPASKRTEAITRMESEREALRQEIRRFEEKRKTLDPRKDAVEIAEIKQVESGHESKIHMLDFSITEEIRKAPEPKSDPTKSAFPKKGE